MNKMIYPHIESLCENCMWYLGNRECTAFPDGIPTKIWKGEHKEPIPRQSFDFVFVEKGPLI